MESVTAENITEHIARKKAELAYLEKLSQEMLNKAVSKARCGSKKAQLQAFRDEGETATKTKLADFSNNYYVKKGTKTSNDEMMSQDTKSYLTE